MSTSLIYFSCLVLCVVARNFRSDYNYEYYEENGEKWNDNSNDYNDYVWRDHGETLGQPCFQKYEVITKEIFDQRKEASHSGGLSAGSGQRGRYTWRGTRWRQKTNILIYFLTVHQVQHGDKFYVAKWWTSNNTPGEEWGAWELVGDSCSEDGDTGEVIDVDVDEEEKEAESNENEVDKEAESNENEVDNSNKWDHEYVAPSLKEAEAREAELTDTPLFEMVKSSIASLASEEVDKIAPGLASNPANVKRVESIMTSDQWDYLFAVRDPDYTYRRHKLVYFNNFLM